MYRDAEKVLRERARCVAEEAARQRAQLSPEDVAALPEALRIELDAVEERLACAELSPAAVADAEEALDEQARLVKWSRATLAEQHRDQRRERHDRALSLAAREQRRRRMWLGTAVMAALFGASYGVVLVRAGYRCRHSQSCSAFGRCGVDSGGLCVAKATADCARSLVCRAEGRCTLSGRYCIAAQDADCAGSADCIESGRCSAARGRCVADRDEDCLASAGCAREHLCKASGGVCVWTLR